VNRQQMLVFKDDARGHAQMKTFLPPE